MSSEVSAAAILREKDAEIEYLRTRNLQLSAAIDKLAAQLAELKQGDGDDDPGLRQTPTDD